MYVAYIEDNLSTSALQDFVFPDVVFLSSVTDVCQNFSTLPWIRTFRSSPLWARFWGEGIPPFTERKTRLPGMSEDFEGVVKSSQFSTTYFYT